MHVLGMSMMATSTMVLYNAGILSGISVEWYHPVLSITSILEGMYVPVPTLPLSSFSFPILSSPPISPEWDVDQSKDHYMNMALIN
jgi:hypothetical protein